MTSNETNETIARIPPEMQPRRHDAEADKKMEKKSEHQGEKETERARRNIENQPSEATLKFRLPSIRKPRPVAPPIKDEITMKIERVLEEGVGDAYQRLSPIAKQEFKIKGEETAVKIREMLLSTHVKAKKIFRLILDWLKMLPGINRFFLEQEAKIKTDKIIMLHEQKK